MKSIYIYGHLGLGDQIACNGIVNTYTDSYDRVYVFTKPKNVRNVMWMYRNNEKVKLIAMEENQVRQFMFLNPQNEYLVVGHEKLHEELRRDPNGRFDQVFYKMANVPFENKWKRFSIDRDPKGEIEAFESLNLTVPYVFVHDDRERPITKHLPSGIKIVRPDRMDLSPFDYLTVIERAEEVHCIDSSFFNLIDCLMLRSDDRLFFHKYVKIHLVGEGGTPTTKLNWTIYG